MTEHLETPVLIVGGGPVGLALAVDLGWRGVACTLIDQSDGTIDQPKLTLINVRSMEFCRRWGVADAVRACPYATDYPQSIAFVTSLAGYRLAHQPYATFAEEAAKPFSPERHQRCSQIWFDPILRQAASSYPHVSVRQRHRLERFEADEDGVTASVTDLETGRPVTIRARYLIGCDGASSGIRKALGIAMAGRMLSHSVNVFFRAPEMWRYHDKGKAERYIFVDPDGTWGVLTAIDGHELWRLSITGDRTQVEMAGFDPDALLRRGMDIDAPYEILSVAPWTRLEMVAERFGDGRVLLAGDAVHCFSPTGGFGGNTGIGDAVDLGWKLAATLDGWGGAGLLKSYQAERRPVALRNTSEAARNFGRLVSPGPSPLLLDDSAEGQRQRDAVGELIRSQTQKEWETAGIQLGYRYEGSPLVVPDGTPAPPDDSAVYVPTARPGSRAPHAWLPDGRSILDVFGAGFTLLRFDPALSATAITAAAEALHAPLEILDIDDPATAALYERPLVLVRPDGHVAWRGDDGRAAADIIATATGRAKTAE